MGGRKTLYNDVLSAIDDFLTNGSSYGRRVWTVMGEYVEK